MSEQPICGKCGLPIHQAETGLRYFGHYIAHNENRCLELLRSSSEALERQLAEVRGELAQTKAHADGYRTRAEMTQAGFDAVSDELTTLRQSLQRAEGKVKQYHAYREACEQYIGLARLYLSKNDPHKAYGFLRELCDKLDVVDGDKPTASDGGGE